MEGKKTTARPSRRTASARPAAAAPRKAPAKLAAAKPGARARAGAAGAPTADERLRMVEMAAFFRAERRGFEPGHEVEDWIAAEAEIDGLFPAVPQKKPAKRVLKAPSG
jgi:hypothetical protein